MHAWLLGTLNTTVRERVFEMGGHAERRSLAATYLKGARRRNKPGRSGAAVGCVGPSLVGM